MVFKDNSLDNIVEKASNEFIEYFTHANEGEVPLPVEGDDKEGPEVIQTVYWRARQ